MPGLRFALRLNAASCLLFGALFAALPARVAELIGSSSATSVRIVGVALLGNALHLLVASRRARIRRAEIFYFAAGDLLWVTATLLMIASGSLFTTATSAIAAIAIAAFVGWVGIRQLWALAQGEPLAPADDRLSDTLSTAQSIAASWMAMKSWVKAWLFALNAVFLLSVMLWPDALARYTLASYGASGPWLLAFMVYQRGLTRLLGVAHLVPWIPLLVYLAVRIGSDAAGAQLSLSSDPSRWWYAVLLSAMLCLCLAFDAADAWRWARGERYTLGSINAVRAGASAPAKGVTVSR